MIYLISREIFTFCAYETIRYFVVSILMSPIKLNINVMKLETHKNRQAINRHIVDIVVVLWLLFWRTLELLCSVFHVISNSQRY